MEDAMPQPSLRAAALALACASLLLAGCASDQYSSNTAVSAQRIQSGPGQSAVPCLLPGQVRQLGTGLVYLSPRRLTRTTPSDCEIRGGQLAMRQ
jgi:hypothetical protein